jgi:hypothetical protein
MNEVIVILYKDSVYGGENKVECVVKNHLAFTEWLAQHNDDRRELSDDDDFCEETEDDFELISVPFF